MTPGKFVLALLAGLAMLGLLIGYLILRDDMVRDETPISTQDDGRAPTPSPTASEPVTTADARLSGPTDCVRGPFRVRVRGSEISEVTFFVDGNRRRTVEAEGGDEASLRIDPREQSDRLHRVRADVRFSDDSAAADTMSLVYQRCPQNDPAVRFTR